MSQIVLYFRFFYLVLHYTLIYLQIANIETTLTVRIFGREYMYTSL